MDHAQAGGRAVRGRRGVRWCAALLLLGVAGATCRAGAEEAAGEEFFEKRVRPILAGTCFRCHGGPKVSGGLRVDSREALLRGGESGPAIDLAAPERSLLLRAVQRSEDVSAMPPDKPLADRQVADLTAWLRAGAPWPTATARFESETHWAFRPVQAPPLPTVGDPSWLRTSLDAFILAGLERAGRTPMPPADRRTWLRRVTYDLTGLPPTPEEVAAFEQDPSPQAWESVVDRLLDSPHYGEHWGRHWLDVVRYADTAGENSDHPLPHAWRYRNWVIQALQADLPYDEFLRAQIAGDILAADAPEAQRADLIVATGYLAIARRFGHDIDKDMHLTLEDTIDTLGKSVLGLSLGCCRCHDHKYDPLTTRDYYGLYGIFDSTRFAFPGCEPKQQPRDLIPLLFSPTDLARVQEIDQQLAAADQQLKQLTAEQTERAKKLQEQASAGTEVLAEGNVGEGESTPLTQGARRPLEGIPVKSGDVLRLVVLPRGNHGADSTLVEWTLSESGGTRRWSVADLVSGLTQGNPHADTHGHSQVWCFLDLQNGPQLLPEVVAEVDGRKELQAWRNGGAPSVFVNSARQPVKVWTELPPQSFFVHPGERGPVAVAWISPIDGTVDIAGRVADAHPAGLDGVSWKLERITGTDFAAQLARLSESRAALATLTSRRGELAARRPVVPLAYAVAEGTPHHARIQRRGEPADLGDEVPRKFLDVLGGQAVTATAGSGRRELAQWLTDRRNPLTARVIANRLWQWHFGRGLVATPNDFGSRGASPTHPELLDHLASQLVTGGWRWKPLHRQIVLSATYRQSATSSEFSGEYAGFPRRRLTAEELRDTLLAVSGEWDRSPGGAHPFPPEASWSFTQHGPFAAEYETFRRSVYVMQKRNRRSRFFALFDGPDPNASTPVRDVTTVPTQALFFLNDPFLHARAARFAERVVGAGTTDPERLDFAYRTLLGRNATAQEQEDAARFRQDYGAALGEQAAAERQAAAWSAYARVLLGSNEVLYVD
ncbi:MAG: PSD1 and planctomycete cytochrome C domain-containing protein [Pirellulales bacterium]